MALEISDFPHADYNTTQKRGFLCMYYPHDAVKDGSLKSDLWKRNSYSPEILNYKEGTSAALEYFVEPFHQLIRHVMELESAKKVCLVPVPSSLKSDDSMFSRKPRNKANPKSRNRDDRNTVFCHLLSDRDSSLITVDILLRHTSKPEKMAWNAAQHESSLELRLDPTNNFDFGIPFILVDDVSTHGGTLEGSKRVIQKKFRNTKIVTLSIGQSGDPLNFKAVGLP